MRTVTTPLRADGGRIARKKHNKADESFFALISFSVKLNLLFL
jgi:hypothetical protein